MGMGMGTGKFTREWGWGIFCGDGVGMGKISWGLDGDGENFMGMGTILFTVSLSSLDPLKMHFFGILYLGP